MIKELEHNAAWMHKRDCAIRTTPANGIQQRIQNVGQPVQPRIINTLNPYSNSIPIRQTTESPTVSYSQINHINPHLHQAPIKVEPLCDILNLPDKTN